MCGIAGFLGKKAILNTMTGIKSLEYRGYDSSGIAYIDNSKVKIIKEKGKVENLEKDIDYNIDSNISIAHTRWATHGIPNKTNAHPHNVGKITLVHNGIIENYEEIKDKLNYKPKSETDSEILAALINDLYIKLKDMKKVLSKLKKIVKGTYAVLIINEDYKDTLFATRNDSPLIVGKKNNEIMFASDIPAILHFTNHYYLLDNYDIVIATKNKIEFLDNNLKAIVKKGFIYDEKADSITKAGYEHFMLKEINEEPEVFKKIISKYIKDNKIVDMFDISKYNEIEIVACGSAYHAGLIGKYYIENIAGIKVTVTYASEYRYSKHFFNTNNLVIVISQSGETADTLAALKIAKESGVDTLAIVNVYKSSIARLAKYVVYTESGIEIAVATTKAYLAQCLVLLLLALNKSQDENMIKELFKIPNILTKYINKDYKQVAKIVAKYDHIFYLGRELDYYLAMEGSLKLKEISYIHSEAYPAGELKHGTISLMDKNTLVIAVVTLDNIKDKTISNLKEIASRNAKIVTITVDADFKSDYKIQIEENILSPFATIIPMQLLAYEVAKIKGCDIDKPRNLAKSVTVE